MSKDGQVDRAKRDLARRLGVDQASITVRSVQETDWPDASLGVAEHGKAYAQMIVFGYIIMLSRAGAPTPITVTTAPAWCLPSGAAPQPIYHAARFAKRNVQHH